MPNPVPSDIIKARSRTLIELNDRLSLDFIKQFINTPVDIIIENAKNQSGRCQRYFLLQVIGQPKNLAKNAIVQASINPDCKTATYIRTL
jgi:tRNA A37 methylthiotransferase MiaB